MTLDTYLSFQPADVQPTETPSGVLSLIDNKAKLAGSKLEVLTVLVVERLQIQARNVSVIDSHKETVLETLNRINAAALYHLREHKDKGIFYERLFALETERRQESVECWRDIVMVMKELLLVWETHEQAQSRALFLKDAER